MCPHRKLFSANVFKISSTWRRPEPTEPFSEVTPRKRWVWVCNGKPLPWAMNCHHLEATNQGWRSTEANAVGWTDVFIMVIVLPYSGVKLPLFPLGKVGKGITGSTCWHQRQLSCLRCPKPSNTPKWPQTHFWGLPPKDWKTHTCTHTCAHMTYQEVPTWALALFYPSDFMFCGLFPPSYTDQDANHHFNPWTSKLQQSSLV